MIKKNTKAKEAATNSPGARARAHRPSSSRRTCPRYKIGESKTATGRKTIDIGDATAELLRGKPLDRFYLDVQRLCVLRRPRRFRRISAVVCRRVE